MSKSSLRNPEKLVHAQGARVLGTALASELKSHVAAPFSSYHNLGQVFLSFLFYKMGISHKA